MQAASSTSNVSSMTPVRKSTHRPTQRIAKQARLGDPQRQGLVLLRILSGKLRCDTAKIRIGQRCRHTLLQSPYHPGVAVVATIERAIAFDFLLILERYPDLRPEVFRSVPLNFSGATPRMV